MESKEQKVYPGNPVLLVDDEKNFLNSLEFDLRSYGITNVESCQDSRQVMERLKQKRYAAIVLDVLMPHITGDELLPHIVEAYPDIPVIVVTAFPDRETSAKCLKKGAFDCHTKPIDTVDLIRTLRDAWELKDVHKEIICSKKELFSEEPHQLKILPNLITGTQEMLTIIQDIGLIAFTSKSVLIRGENGVGKEFLAREIHQQSLRKGKFVSLNTVGLDDESFNSNLFGYKKGAFPGAVKDVEGIVADARGGTLYINEIATLALETQSKLLRLLQNREYFPLGANESKAANARVIVASTQNLSALLQVGALHPGLYTHLKSQEIFIPPLRERKEDIHLLFNHFFVETAKKDRITPPKLPPELFPLLEKYEFPGNISELKKMVQEAVTRYKSGVFPMDVFLLKMQKSIASTPSTTPSANDSWNSDEEIPTHDKIIFRGPLPTFAEMEAIYMDEIMKRSGRDYNAAARLSGLNQKILIQHLRKAKKFHKKMNNKI